MVAEIKAQGIQGHHIHPFSLLSPPWSGGNCPISTPISLQFNQAQLHHLGILWGFFLLPGMHLLRNTRKSGRTPEYGKKRRPSFSAQKGDTHCTKRPTGVWGAVTGPPHQKTLFLSVGPQNPGRRRNTWCSRGCFSGWWKRKGAVLPWRQHVPAAPRSGRISPVPLFVQNQL